MTKNNLTNIFQSETNVAVISFFSRILLARTLESSDRGKYGEMI